MNPITSSSQPASSNPLKKSPRRSRIAAILLIIAVLITLTAFAAPHVVLRVPIVLVTIIGLWREKRWSYPLLWVSVVVWLLMLIAISPFLLIAVLWIPWLYWGVPTILVIVACLIMTFSAGRAERATWKHRTGNNLPQKTDESGEQS